MLGAEVRVYWRQDFSRENVCETLASPGQGTMQIYTELRKKLGLGAQGVAVAWQREYGIMRSREGLMVAWDPPRNHVQMRIPVLEFCLLDSFAFPRIPYKWEHTLHSF